MIHKTIREIYNVDIISQDKGWKKINNAVEEIGEEVEIDFKGVKVITPWECDTFKQIIKNNNVHMKFTNEPDLVNRIRMMCLLEGSNEQRITNIEVEIPKEKSQEEKKIEMYGKGLIPCFHNNIALQFDCDESWMVMNVKTKYSQLHNSTSLGYIEYAINYLVKYKEKDKFILDIQGISILDDVLETLAEIIVRMESNGITLLAWTDNEDVKKTLQLSLHKVTNRIYTPKEKYKALIKNIKPNTAGMLIKYKKSRAVDTFGRFGKGEVISSKIAIFRGLKKSETGGTPLFIVETFNSHTFYTQQHWIAQHDNEMLDKLDSETVEITMNELGFGDLFLGTSYHFIEPIQQDKKESDYIVIDLDENGKNIKKLCTIPERMKLVFDDWGINYNKDKLDEAIKKTQEKLNS